MTHESRLHTLDTEDLAPLAAWLADAIGADRVTLSDPDILTGGAIGENWALGAVVEGGPRAGRHDWVLRTDALARMALSHDRADEFACMRAAHEAGMRVPEPIAACRDASLIGAPFHLMERIEGYAQARRIVRDPAVVDYGEALGEALGRELARLHTISPPRSDLAFLEVPDVSPGHHAVSQLRTQLDAVSEPRPALEYILAWLDDNAPERGDIVLCHGDYRTGNYMVGERGQLHGILDWEQAHWGDRHEDAGYFCARCWRFGGDEIDPMREAGGISSRAAFLRGYASVAGAPLDARCLPYWEIMAAARWAVIALLQGKRHHTGGETSLELLLTGMMAPEMELDALMEIEKLRVAEGRP